MSAVSIFRLCLLALALASIVYGLLVRTPGGRILLPLGIMGVSSAALYFLNGRVSAAVLVPVALAVFAPALVWLIRAQRAPGAKS